jgi:hypothetical protein
MRIWDLDPSVLCRQHLLGEHRELHALWTILTKNRSGYMSHPETKRWVGKLPALHKRHEALVHEMKKRSYNHHSPLNDLDVEGLEIQEVFVHTPEEQIEIIQSKKCECRI